ncbi:ATP-binding protein [Pseudophaeobacter sp.]|uniref:AAA family ATPase n=1 Tax=Pseudophaeobacter sp. TaxID=1971739 RepID=UPI003297BDC1
MTSQLPTLHLFCGKIASGKSTLAAKLSRRDRHVLLSEDSWLSALYPEELRSPADYLRCTTRLRQAMGPHVIALLNTGISVVLDFSANTVEARQWMRSLLDQTKAANQLHVLAAKDALCLQRLARRNAAGEHPFQTTEGQFHQFSKYFVAPIPEEGFSLVWHNKTSEPQRR